MKKKLLAGLLLVTLAIGTFSPATVMAATTPTKTKTTTTKKKTPTKVDGVKISDLLSGKYNKIKTVTRERERETNVYLKSGKLLKTEYGVLFDEFHYKSDGLYLTANVVKAYGLTGDGTKTEYKTTSNTIGETPSLYYNDKNTYEQYAGFFKDRPMESRKKEIAKWKLDPSRFKTTKTKVTKDEITITGTYTFSVKNVTDKYYEADKEFNKLKFDLDFWDVMLVNPNQLDKFKDVKCSATVVFNRETKQIKSLELKATLPKKGYATNTQGLETITIYNASFTFEHSK